MERSRVKGLLKTSLSWFSREYVECNLGPTHSLSNGTRKVRL